ncbi:MAG: MtnX-like HAD-IB family phosphatase [Defluviitaleaceae bacterium]|nr:MtnX-like HAD-IB family phosphatase [Defluviitaleaceae bacterium]
MTLLVLNEYVIVSDFDGTITQEDSNDVLVHTLGTLESMQIEADFIAGRIGNREAMARHFEAMSITAKQYKEFMITTIHLDSGFDDFLTYIRNRGIPFFVVSAGFRQGIECILGKSRLDGVQVFANVLSGNPYLKASPAHDEPLCDKTYGPCSICKKVCIDEIRQKTNKKIIYIGDGMTDRCVEADLLFAKHHLANHCEAHTLPYQPFETFDDITRFLKDCEAQI